MRRIPGVDRDRKQEILAYLKIHAGAPLNDVARHLGVSRQAALRHLESLHRAGLVDFNPEARRAPGRPGHLYHLTPLAATRFPGGHRELAGELVQFVGNDALDRFFAARTARIEAEYASRMQGNDLRSRAVELARLATERGHMAEVVETEDGSIAIRQCHCPIGDVAMESRTPCRHELEMYERLLGAGVARAAFMPDQDSTCTYVIKGSGR